MNELTLEQIISLATNTANIVMSAHKPMHVCCAIGDNKLWIITAYYPTEEKWESDYKTRKAVRNNDLFIL